MKKYWIVQRASQASFTNSNRTYWTHKTKKAAVDEARRLAKQLHDTFYVLETVTAFSPSEVVEVTLYMDGE